MNERGQTVYDFLLGVVLFLAVVASIFAIFPEVFSPFFDPSPGDREEMADRVADDLIENASAPQEERTLRYAQLNDTLQNVDGPNSEIKARAGVPEIRNLYVKLQNSSSPVLAVSGAGEAEWGNEPQDVWASSVRTVRFSDLEACDPACQLVVRVW